MSTPELVLYRSPGACSMIPAILLHELSLPFKSVQMTRGASGTLEAKDGSVSAAAFAALNPKTAVPTLTVDGAVVTEAAAVLTAIASLKPGSDLLGKPGMENVKVLEWVTWLSGSLHGQGFGKLWAAPRFVPAGSPEEYVEAVRKSGRETIEKGFGMVEDKLPGGKHAVGGHLTVVDIQLHTFWRWGKQIGVDMETKYPRYKEVVEDLEKLESVKATMAEEGIPLQFGK